MSKISQTSTSENLVVSSIITNQDLPRFPETISNDLSTRRKLLGDESVASQMYRNLLAFTKLHFKICNFICTLYYEWDDKTNRIILLRSKFKLAIVKFHVFLHWAYTLSMTGYFICTLDRNNPSAMLLGYAFIASWGVCALMQTEFWQKRSEALIMYRSMMEFEEKYLPPTKSGSPKRRDKVCQVLMTLGIVSCFGLPACMSVILLINPCQPPHLGYVLFKKSLRICAVPSWHVRLLVLAFDVYLWIVALPIGLFYVFQGLLVGVRCQEYYLRLLRGGLKRPLDKIYEESKERVIFKIYRELLIMNKLYNRVFQAVFFPGVIAVGIFVAVMGMFACLKLRKVIPFPAIMFFPIIASDGFSIIYVSKIAAGTYIQSVRFLRTIKTSTKHSKKTWYSKVAISFDQLKIRFGGNFVDQLTPLVFLDFVFSQTVSLMLLTDK